MGAGVGAEEQRRGRRCVVVTPVGPGHEALAEQARASVAAACQAGTGPFAEVAFVPLLDLEGAHGRSSRRNDGIRYALAKQFDWIFFLDADDLMAREAFTAVAPYVEDHDAVFGQITVFDPVKMEAEVRPHQMGATSSLADVLRFDPAFSLQMGHFVRTSAAASIGFDTALNTGEDFKYYLELWRQYRCTKLAQTLFYNRRGQHSTGPRSADGRQWRLSVNKVFEAFCARYPQAVTFSCDGQQIQFVLGNPRDLIHQHWMAGHFFESEELAYLREKVGPHATILEVGANVGNHVVYYGRFMKPAKIIPIEPNPAAIALLKQNIGLNHVKNVDLSLLGFGIGDTYGHFDMEIEDQGNIGAARLLADAKGSVEVFPLDAKYAGPVDFMKIDVEWMEMEALRGAEKLIAKNRPKIYIEIMHANTEAFRAWAEENHYRIERTFPYVNADNFYLVPE